MVMSSSLQLHLPAHALFHCGLGLSIICCSKFGGSNNLKLTNRRTPNNYPLKIPQFFIYFARPEAIWQNFAKFCKICHARNDP